MPVQEMAGLLRGTGVEEKKKSSLWANMRSQAKSAKERFKDYVAEKEAPEENGTRSSKIMELMKAKAQSISSQVQGTVAATRSSSSRSRSSSAKPAQARA